MAESLPTNTEIPVSLAENSQKNHGPSKKVLILAGLLITAIFIGVFLVFLSGANNPKVAELNNLAKNAYLSGDYKTAEEKYNEALSIDDDDPDALSGAISTIVTLGNQTGKEKAALEKAKPIIDKALATNAKNQNVLLVSGYAYEAAGDYQKALELYERALDENQDSSQALFRHAHALEFLGKRDEAYKEYEKAYSLNPNDPLVLIAKGNMHLSDRNFQDSFDLFKQAAAAEGVSNQTKAEALTAASLVRGAQEDFKYIKEAAELSRQAVEADPNFSPALAAHGYNLFLTSPDKNDGIEYIERAISANPRIAKNYFLLGAFKRADQKFGESINNIKEAISRTDNDNTLLGESAKRTAKGTYSYELAKTYSLAKLSVDVMPLIRDAVAFNPSLVERVREDTIRNNLFQDIQNSKEFVDLIGK